jgi:hypothetical protein
MDANKREWEEMPRPFLISYSRLFAPIRGSLLLVAALPRYADVLNRPFTESVDQRGALV